MLWRSSVNLLLLLLERISFLWKNSKILTWMLKQESDQVEHLVRKLDSHLILKVHDELVDFVDGSVTSSISAYWNEPSVYFHGGILYSSSITPKVRIFQELIFQIRLTDISHLHMTNLQKKYLLPSKATFIQVEERLDMKAWQKYFEKLCRADPSLVVIFISAGRTKVKISDIMFADVVVYSGPGKGIQAIGDLCFLRSDVPYLGEPKLGKEYDHIKTVIEGIPESLDAKLEAINPEERGFLGTITVEAFYYHRVIYDTTEHFHNLKVGADWKWIVPKVLGFINKLMKIKANMFERAAILNKFASSV